MRLIGRKSLSGILVYVSLAVFTLQLLNLLVSLFFFLGKGVGNYSFAVLSTRFVMTGQYTATGFYTGIVYLLYYSLFSLFLYPVFRGMSKETVFTTKVVTALKRFAWLNLLFLPLCLFPEFLIRQATIADSNLMVPGFDYFLLHLVLGIVIFFMIAFFQKGLELQSQADLTI